MPAHAESQRSVKRARPLVPVRDRTIVGRLLGLAAGGPPGGVTTAGGTGPTSRRLAAVSACPASSRTVTVGWKVLHARVGERLARVRRARDLRVPSPSKSKSKETTVPSGAVEPEASKLDRLADDRRRGRHGQVGGRRAGRAFHDRELRRAQGIRAHAAGGEHGPDRPAVVAVGEQPAVGGEDRVAHDEERRLGRGDAHALGHDRARDLRSPRRRGGPTASRPRSRRRHGPRARRRSWPKSPYV